ncbi:hypothetical protein ACM78Z_26675 [Pseudomonas aeruginosa]
MILKHGFISAVGVLGVLSIGSTLADVMSCRYVFNLKLYTKMCSEELDGEWRPKLNPERSCARLINEVETFNQAFGEGLIEFNDSCARQEVMKVGENAANVLRRARAKGWTTMEQYLSY